jgi:septum formation protein
VGKHKGVVQIKMIRSQIPIILASKSPRRKKLLKQIGLVFRTKSFDVEENLTQNLPPAKLAKKLALQKLEAAKSQIKNSVIITADTIVVLEGEILGKPKNKREAVAMLKKLSGAKHHVYTGFAVYNGVTDELISDYEKTCVAFRELSEKEIKEYVASGSPLDKAGSYGIQDDYGAVFVRKISGCYYNVVGLPLAKVYLALQKVLQSEKI